MGCNVSQAEGRDPHYQTDRITPATPRGAGSPTTSQRKYTTFSATSKNSASGGAGGSNSDEEEDEMANSTHSSSTRSVNTFTASYASLRPPTAPLAYNPGFVGEEDSEEWKLRQQLKERQLLMLQEERSASAVESFIFGDFELSEPEKDVQRLRQERFNRGRKKSGVLSPPPPAANVSASTTASSASSDPPTAIPLVSSTSSGSGSSGSITNSPGGGNGANVTTLSGAARTFEMNDFKVGVDEADSPADNEYRGHDGTAGGGAVNRDYGSPTTATKDGLPLNRTVKGFSLRQMPGHPTRVKTLAIPPHGKFYASACTNDCALTLTSLSTGEEMYSLPGHMGPIVSAVSSWDGRYMATCSRDNTVRVWDTKDLQQQGAQIRCFDFESLPICVTFSSCGGYLVVGCQNARCYVWDIFNGVETLMYHEHDSLVVSVVALPRGEHVVVTGGADRTIRMWDIRTGQTIRQFIGHDAVVINLSLNANGDRLLSNDDRACKVWQLDTGACICNVTLETLMKASKTAQQSSGGRKADEVAAGNAMMDMRRPPQPLPRAYYEKFNVPMRTYGFSNNGVMGTDALNATRLSSTRPVFTLSCLAPGVLSEGYFLVASTNKTVYMISLATGKEVLSFPTKAPVFAITAAAKTSKVLFGDIFGNVSNVVLQYD